MKAERIATNAYEKAKLEKNLADGEVQLREYAVTQALANCEPPEAECNSDSVMAALAVLEPLAQAVEEAQTTLTAASRMKDLI